MQLTYVVDVETDVDWAEDFAYIVSSVIEDRINEIYSSAPDIKRAVVQKVFLTLPDSLIAVDPKTAVRIDT